MEYCFETNTQNQSKTDLEALSEAKKNPDEEVEQQHKNYQSGEQTNLWITKKSYNFNFLNSPHCKPIKSSCRRCILREFTRRRKPQVKLEVKSLQIQELTCMYYIIKAPR